jgi:TolB-like protein/class 3 adenylate cyclase/Tfp pilus assembly protein PilF
MTTTSRLGAILNADVVGYSHLIEADEKSTLILDAIHRLTVDGPGYSGLLKAGEEGMLEQLKTQRREIVDVKITEHGGRILKAAGDGMLVAFADPIEAVRCAVEMQRGLTERNANAAPEKRLAFRIAINAGNEATDEVTKITAGLRALAEPGGVCISRAIHQIVRDRLPYRFEDIGERTVKDIAVPVHAYAMSTKAVESAPDLTAQMPPAPGQRWLGLKRAVAVASVAVTICIWSAAWWWWLGRNSSPTPIAEPPVAANPQTPQVAASIGDKPILAPLVPEEVRPRSPGSAEAPLRPRSIVVMPFANLSNDPGQKYFADAITDEVTSELSRIPETFVIARNTAFAPEIESPDPQALGRELNVRYVLEGGARQAGNQVWIDARLIDTETGTWSWEERFETDRAKILEAENKIALRLTRTFGLDPMQRATLRLDRERAVDPDAHDSIMRGWGWYYRPYSTATWQEARSDFERALEFDPSSIDARIGLATILGGKLAEGWTPSLQQDTARAEELLSDALERDPGRAAAHFAMGVLRQMQNRLPEAQAEFEAAIALDRNHARGYLHLGQTLMFLGHPEAGARHIATAIQLNPYDPNISTAYWALGACYLLLGQLDEAINLLRKAQAANEKVWFPHLYLAGALGLEGSLDEAKRALAEANKLNPAINSLARLRGQNPWLTHPRHWDLQEQTLNVGLQRAGLAQE